MSRLVYDVLRVIELTGPALDWAVAKCEGVDYLSERAKGLQYKPSECWVDGGEIIEREKISIYYHDDACEWISTWQGQRLYEADCFGNTALIAAMRAFVASKLGDEVEVPEELK